MSTSCNPAKPPNHSADDYHSALTGGAIIIVNFFILAIKKFLVISSFNKRYESMVMTVHGGTFLRLGRDGKPLSVVRPVLIILKVSRFLKSSVKP